MNTHPICRIFLSSIFLPIPNLFLDTSAPPNPRQKEASHRRFIQVRNDQDLRDGTKALADRCVKLAANLVSCGQETIAIERGGR